MAVGEFCSPHPPDRRFDLTMVAVFSRAICPVLFRLLISSDPGDDSLHCYADFDVHSGVARPNENKVKFFWFKNQASVVLTEVVLLGTIFL